MKISLCMIVKNEEKYIKQCLDSALPIVDNIVVTDTGSDDSTINILREFGDSIKVVEHKWKNDFSEARNISLQHSEGDWIFIMDADEKLICDKEKLIDFLSTTKTSAFRVPIYNLLSSGRVERSVAMIRVFKNDGARYIGALHEQLIINGKPALSDIIDENVCKIIHYGYLRSTFEGKDKTKRNVTIIRSEIKKNPDNAFNWYNLGVMNMIDEKYEEALDNFINSNKLRKGRVYGFESNMVLRMAQCLWTLKSYKMCKDLIEEAIKDPKLAIIPDFNYYLGFANKELGLMDEAISNFSKCIEIGEGKSDVSHGGMGSFIPLIEWARILDNNGLISEAIMKYMEAVFSPYNYRKEGAAELALLLRKHNMTEVLEELKKLTGKENL